MPNIIGTFPGKVYALKRESHTVATASRPHPLAHLCAGGPSMMIFIQSICMALRGLGSPRRVDKVMRVSAAMLLRWVKY